MRRRNGEEYLCESMFSDKLNKRKSRYFCEVTRTLKFSTKYKIGGNFVEVKMNKLLIVVLCVVSLGLAKPLWVRDNAQVYKYRGICVINDSIAWVVGESGHVWIRTGSLHSHNWTRITNLPSGYINYHLNDVCFMDAGKGWIVGEKKAEPNKYRGIVYKTTDAGTNWDSVIPLPSPPNLPTPFLKVRFANQNEGYISCGNGIVLKTGDGGSNWSKTTSDPWNDTNNTSVWYGGLGLVDGSNLWVSGDAFGVLSKSTDAGANWTAYQPSAFEQDYTFPSGTVTPYNTRLANFDMDLLNMNDVRIGLSYGNVGVTTNSGTNWSIQNWESQPVWFYDIAACTDSSFHGVGNYHVINHDGNHDHNIWNERANDPFVNVPFRCIDFSDNNIGYAAKNVSSSSYYPILQNYDPAGFVFDGTVVNAEDSTIEVYWHTTFEKNTSSWGIDFRYMVPMYTGPYIIHVPAAGHASSYACTLDAYVDPWIKWYYVSIILFTNDPQYNSPPYFLFHGPEEVEVPWAQDSARLSAPNPLVVEDRTNDQGGALELTWASVTGALNYFIGRSEYETGPF